MDTSAIIIDSPGALAVRKIALNEMGESDVLVDVHWSGISTGTEKLLWTGKMPNFPGMGYPLVPGYESVGRVIDAGPQAQERIGEWVFVPGANCYQDARGLFGGSASNVILPSARALPVSEKLGQEGILYALAATGLHAINRTEPPELIVGHGVLGRLIARLTIATGAPAPTVWEINPDRQDGAQGYNVVHPDEDERSDYSAICEVSGSNSVIEPLIQRLAKGGEITLAGFYDQPISFAFPPAFQREARLRVAAEWQPEDLATVNALIDTGALDLSGLITSVEPATNAKEAYPQAFENPECLKMVLDWRETE
ncbi:chlorophyll synthesis pathway protein BchC [Alterisphingorhabdus coralli]|uniref:Chlorophyll synthesis pathway protein BchC n=1 Tax=Alterisphingorhabdus coralli TaxID=3071408 RepID=A0AA97F5E6_9SPHN|nr:chlorophyll synthesis pathway protein BchC [Parasphingorhabdus sp. SCSIO 66989]WOE74516.1 chlorophyll synthesis pathway protein BchC [Parasphingorhabdus sp. SCSIO 66989]